MINNHPFKYLHYSINHSLPNSNQTSIHLKMCASRNLRPLPHHLLEPMYSSPNQVFETLSEWGFTSPVSPIYHETRSYLSSGEFGGTIAIHKSAPIRHNVNYIPTASTPSWKSSSSSSSTEHYHHVHATPPGSPFHPTNIGPIQGQGATDNNFMNVNFAPRRGHLARLTQQEPIENLFDVFDNDHSAFLKYPKFFKDHFGKNYGRRNTIPNRDEIAYRFWGHGPNNTVKEEEKVLLEAFSKASPSPIRQCRKPPSTSSNGSFF